MKKTFKILLICFCAGCSTRKINYEPHVNQVVSQFLRSELANEKYRSFADKQIYIIENSNELKAIEVYEYALKMNGRAGEWPIESSKITALKDNFLKTNDKWKSNDFEDFSLQVITEKEFAIMANRCRNRSNSDRHAKLIIWITKPIFIDQNKALLYFEAQKLDLVNTAIDRYAVLMKLESGKWIKKTKYYDGLYH